MLSRVLTTASRSPRARRTVETFPVSRGVVDRFVAGETDEAALAAAAQVAADGMSSSLDLLGEDVDTHLGAAGTRDAYLVLLHKLHEAGLAGSTEVSLKLSAVGQALADRGEDVALRHARQVCAAADAVGSMVTLDMEGHATTDSTLRVARALRAEYPDTGVVLQSNLRRTPGDLAALADEAAASARALRVRLVKGAYREPPAVAHQHKAEVDRAYTADIAVAMASPLHVMVATHDPGMIAHARQQAACHARDSDSFELQMLFGIRRDLQLRTSASGLRTRVYIPFGANWYAYFMRRLAERPANVAFFLRALAGR